MSIFRHLAAFGLIGVLAGCGDPAQIAVQAPAVTEKVRIAFRAVEVRDVSLPAYAAADAVAIQAEDGTVTTSDVLWADAPERAVALQLSVTLAKLTGARVASEPWPFEAYPQARLLLRFSELAAGTDGVFRASGQYFVAVLEGGRERSGLFEQTVQYDPNGGAAAIARARGQIIQDLAAFVAREGLR